MTTQNLRVACNGLAWVLKWHITLSSLGSPQRPFASEGLGWLKQCLLSAVNRQGTHEPALSAKPPPHT